LIERFAEEAITGEELGQRGHTDLLTVSFSSNDYVGHRVGPDAPEVRDMSIRTDQVLAKLFQSIDREVGMKNVVIVLSADHGVAATPQQDKLDKMPGGYIGKGIEETVESALNQRFGKAKWLIPGGSETGLYFDRQALDDARTVDRKPGRDEQVYAVAKRALLSAPQLHVSRVYSREQLENGIEGDFIARAEMNGYYPRRSPDLSLVFEPGYMLGSGSGTTHFSPYAYDRHVPVLFMGQGIKPGRYDETIMPNDIAPTLATMLAIQTPSGSSGRVLVEILVH
jgi:predicted AlkP superfamily pyrophosphatase or phosphodiesterase